MLASEHDTCVKHVSNMCQTCRIRRVQFEAGGFGAAAPRRPADGNAELNVSGWDAAITILQA